MKLVPYACPHMRIKLRKDPKDTRVSGQANKITHHLVLFMITTLLANLIFLQEMDWVSVLWEEKRFLGGKGSVEPTLPRFSLEVWLNKQEKF